MNQVRRIKYTKVTMNHSLWFMHIVPYKRGLSHWTSDFCDSNPKNCEIVKPDLSVSHEDAPYNELETAEQRQSDYNIVCREWSASVEKIIVRFWGWILLHTIFFPNYPPWNLSASRCFPCSGRCTWHAFFPCLTAVQQGKYRFLIEWTTAIGMNRHIYLVGLIN